MRPIVMFDTYTSAETYIVVLGGPVAVGDMTRQWVRTPIHGSAHRLDSLAISVSLDTARAIAEANRAIAAAKVALVDIVNDDPALSALLASEALDLRELDGRWWVYLAGRPYRWATDVEIAWYIGPQ